MRKFLFALAATALLSTAFAQEPYPARNVTVVVPFSPGASNDTIARYLANGLSKKWGKSVVVENKPGAGGAIGSAQVARANADGYTLLFMSSAYTTMAATTTTKERGFDALADLVPTAMAARGQFVLVTGPSVKAKNFAEFLAEAKARPMFAATPGLNSGSHFAAEALNAAAGIKIDPVNYKGGNEAALDMMAGRVDTYIGSVTFSTPFIKDGKMKALAILSSDRSTALPDVPSIAELGYKDAEFSSWWGVFVPAKTPQAIIDKVNADINALMTSPEGAKFLEGLGASALPIAPPRFKEIVVSEVNRWSKLAEKMKAQAKK